MLPKYPLAVQTLRESRLRFEARTGRRLYISPASANISLSHPTKQLKLTQHTFSRSGQNQSPCFSQHQALVTAVLLRAAIWIMSVGSPHDTECITRKPPGFDRMLNVPDQPRHMAASPTHTTAKMGCHRWRCGKSRRDHKHLRAFSNTLMQPRQQSARLRLQD
ncbi:hypothetical protein KC336_g23 [Hortaea werneckii]|nr:hypothetical protein KC336_g23 [Hortaea werneckii]